MCVVGAGLKTFGQTDASLKGSRGPEIICSGKMGLGNRTLRAGAPGFQTELDLETKMTFLFASMLDKAEALASPCHSSGL